MTLVIPKSRRFALVRMQDISGVSGKGIVALGIQFPSGRVVFEWVVDKTEIHSLVVYDKIEHVEVIHGHGGSTEILWLDEL